MTSKDNKNKEYVLVIPIVELWKAGYFEGFNIEADKYLSIITRSKLTVFKPRYEIVDSGLNLPPIPVQTCH